MLGFEVTNDVGYQGMRWITIARPNQPDTSIATDQPYGIRDCAIRDPAGNMIRIQEIAA